MMKYLLIATTSVLAINTVAYAKSQAFYDNIDHNEDVTRKFNLDIYGAIEVTTDIKFRSASPTNSYYYVVPRELEYNQISIQATVPG